MLQGIKEASTVWAAEVATSTVYATELAACRKEFAELQAALAALEGQARDLGAQLEDERAAAAQAAADAEAELRCVCAVPLAWYGACPSGLSLWPCI